MGGAVFEFDWDPAKAAANLVKHGVGFEEAMSIFLAPLALTVPDDDQSIGEQRWVTIGVGGKQRLLLVVHTHVELGHDKVYIRLISARKPTRRERRDYEQTS